MIEIKLKYPFTTDAGQRVEQITLSRPKAKHLRAIKSKNDIDQALELIAILSGMVLEDIENLDLVDFNTIAKKLGELGVGK